jgi:hypothetical protein
MTLRRVFSVDAGISTADQAGDDREAAYDTSKREPAE